MESLELSKQLLSTLLSYLCYYSIIDTYYMYLSIFFIIYCFHISLVCARYRIDSYQLNVFTLFFYIFLKNVFTLKYNFLKS